MHPDKTRHISILKDEQALDLAKANLKATTEEVQKFYCLHTVVYQTNFHRSSPRICPKCGLEVDSHSTALGTSHWTAKDFIKSPLNNHEDRLVQEVENHIFFLCRIKQ